MSRKQILNPRATQVFFHPLLPIYHLLPTNASSAGHPTARDAEGKEKKIESHVGEQGRGMPVWEIKTGCLIISTMITSI